MFSVVIPLYNKADYLKKSIDSVLAQSFSQYEIIIINDGSTDCSMEVVQQFDFSGIDVHIIDQQNRGVSATRNRGVKEARYKYVAFLDADDWWEPDYLQKMKSLIDNYPDAGIYGSNYFIVKEGKKRAATIGVDMDFTRGEIDYFKVYVRTLYMPLWTSAVVIPRDVFLKEGGFMENLKLGEDLELWIRIALKHKVVFLNKPLANYNQDVDVYNRGVAKDKIFTPEAFMTFNFDHLLQEEEKNQYLKKLLDNVRVVSLSRYRFQNAYPDKVKKIISGVDFSNVSRYYYRLYHWPQFVIKPWYFLLRCGSSIKKHIK